MCTILINIDRLLIATTLPLVTTTRATRLTGMRTSLAPTTPLSLVITIPSCPLSLPPARTLRRVPARVRVLLPPKLVARHLRTLPLLNPRPFLVSLVVVRANLAVMLVVALRLLATVARRALLARRTQAPTREAPAHSHRVWRLVAAPTMVTESLQAALLHWWPSLLLP
jgi:hypothetical protein